MLFCYKVSFVVDFQLVGRYFVATGILVEFSPKNQTKADSIKTILKQDITFHIKANICTVAKNLWPK